MTAASPAPARRTFEGRRVWGMSRDSFRRAVDLLAVPAAADAPDLVVGIQRGGQQLAEALGSCLGRPHVLVRARHNASDAVALAASGEVYVDMSGMLGARPGAGSRLLVADDICGSGATLRAVRTHLRCFGWPRVSSVTLCRNRGASLSPTWWIWDVADWVNFPWEPSPATATSPLPVPTHVRSLP